MANKIEVLSAPSFLYLNLTEKCNLRCTHCYGAYGEKKENELNLEDFKNIIDQLALLKVFYVNLCGGEPTQSAYFKEVIEYLSYKKIHYMLTTNGVMSRNLLEYIDKYGEYLVGIKISLDGFDAKSHAIIRKTPVYSNKEVIFNQTIKSIKFFSDKGYPITIATSLHPVLLGNLSKMKDLIFFLRPTAWYLSPVTENGRANCNSYLFADLDKHQDAIKGVIREVEELGIVTRLVDAVLDDQEYENFSFDCGAAQTHCEIHADGTVSPCTLSRIVMHNKYLKFPNIREKNLEEIWQSNEFDKFRGYQMVGCDGCKSFNSCSRCVAQIFQYYGEPTQAPLFCNSISHKLGLKKNTTPPINQKEQEGVLISVNEIK